MTQAAREARCTHRLVLAGTGIFSALTLAVTGVVFRLLQRQGLLLREGHVQLLRQADSALARVGRAVQHIRQGVDLMRLDLLDLRLMDDGVDPGCIGRLGHGRVWPLRERERKHLVLSQLVFESHGAWLHPSIGQILIQLGAAQHEVPLRLDESVFGHHGRFARVEERLNRFPEDPRLVQRHGNANHGKWDRGQASYESPRWRLGRRIRRAL
mmetsp:Transcript_42100/g.98165  ORF Transcript_42100/g.98165 Transcript_42100/m.98165 type:complete len:212 (-) Transcript_42100:2467-3102(-)